MDTLTHIQSGMLHNRIIGTGSELKNPKLRLLVMYKKTQSTTKFVDSLKALYNTPLFNSDTFRMYLVELYEPPILPGVCPGSSNLTFYGKNIEHSAIADGVWVLMDTTESKLKPTYWEAVKERNPNLRIMNSSFSDSLVQISDKGDFYRMITRPYLQIENAYRKFQNDVDYLLQEIVNLRSELNEANRKHDQSRTTLISISAQQNFLGIGDESFPGLKDFKLDKLQSSNLDVALENRIPKENFAITREISFGFREVSGEIRQNVGTRNESLGYYMRGFNPYERMVYTDDLKENFKLAFVNAGFSLGLRKELNTLDLFFKVGGTVLKSVGTNYNAEAKAISFGGIFPEINPVDTIFSGVGDFYTNMKYAKNDGRVPIESTTLGINLSFGADYWLSAERNIGIKAGLHYQQQQTIFSGTQSALFSSTDLSSYNPLVARLGNASMRGFGLSLGIVYKLQ
ncbi:MAG: hypothetical protein ACK5XN_03510 [Bacteroidota bacterium]